MHESSFPVSRRHCMDGFMIDLYYIDMDSNVLFQGETVTSSRILYTPSAFAKESLIYLQETGTLQARRPHENRRTYLDSFLFLSVLSGSGTVTVHNRKYDLHSGDCVFLDCRNAYSQQSSEDLWTLKWVHFNGESMPIVYQKFLERCGSILFHPSDLSDYSARLDALLETARGDSYVRDMEIHELLSGLLTRIMKDCWKDTAGRTASETSLNRLSPIRSYLRAHFAENISLDELAGMFYINKFYLTRLFREQYGITISAYINELRINHAKQLLRFSDHSLEEIASMCGFYDLSYFSRKFKNAEGIAPSAFRKQWH